MLRLPLIFMMPRSRPSHPPCCAPVGRARWAAVALLFALLLALAALLPRPARALAPAAADPLADVVAEALFLGDSLPPGGHELGLIVGGTPGEDGRLDVLPAMQLALRPTATVGLVGGVTVDPSSDPQTSGLHSPAASLRVLLRSPAAGALGVATCLDLLGPGPGHAAEAAFGLGLVRAVGTLTLRASTSFTTPLTGWGPRLHAGLSAATAVGGRWRLLAEAIVETAGGAASVLAGPGAKVALLPDAALAAGALLDLARPDRPPRLVAQLTLAL